MPRLASVRSPVSASPISAPSRWRWTVTVPLKLLLGAWFTQSLLGSLLVFGWLQRWGQRAAFKQWWKQGPRREPSFAAFACTDPSLQDHRHAPNWLLVQNHARPVTGWRSALSGGLRSGWLNLRLGLQGLLNVAALTLPAGVLWLLGWWGGWQNSFHKGYEQAYVGPLVSSLGIAAFAAAMLYVPLALTRQAVTGQWRAFWQWRTVTLLIRRSWIASAALALLFVGLNLGAMALKSGPYFVTQAMTEAQALAFLNRYYLFSAAYLFGALLLLRTAAARVYAGAVLRGVQSGALGEEQLAENEWRILHRLELLQHRPAPARPRWIRFAAWAASRSAGTVGAIATGLLWLVFVAQIYVSEFLDYHPVRGWLNQPLIQLPWFRYVPAHLESPAGEIAFTLLVLALFTLSLHFRRRFRHAN